MAAALWDIFDDHDEIYDRLSDGFNNIWDVLQDQTSDEDTFSDFYDSQCDPGHDKPKANSAIFQNDIDYNLPPGVTVANPEPGHVYFGIIQTLTYTTDEGGDVPHTEYWYSLDNINWHQLDLPIGKGGYSTRGEGKWWYVDWNTSLYIDGDDSVWLRVYATDNLEDSINGVTESPPYYWHIYINDIQVPDEDIDSYQLRGGEVIHWECSKMNDAGE